MSRWWRSVVGLLAAVLLGASVAMFAPALPAAGQQTDCPPEDPYSGGQECPAQITLSLSLQFGPAGVRVRIRAHGFNAGDPVTVTFDGVVIIRTVARPGTGQTAVGAPGGFAAAGLGLLRSIVGQSDATRGGIDEIFTVPDKPPGLYAVCVSGSGAQGCGQFRITATEVAGVSFTRSGGTTSAQPDSGTRVLGRTYARTGFAIALFVVVGVSLVMVGRFLRVASRRRGAHG